MGGVRNFQNFSKLGGAIRLKWVKKIENSVIDPPTIRDGRVRVSLPTIPIFSFFEIAKPLVAVI